MTIEEKLNEDTTAEFLDDYIWNFVEVDNQYELIENLEFICKNWPGEPEIILTLLRSYSNNAITLAVN